MKSDKVIDLSLLLRLVSELEKTANNAEHAIEANKDIQEYLIELSKSIGLCSSISQESLLLVGDIANIFSKSSSLIKEVELTEKPVNKKPNMN